MKKFLTSTFLVFLLNFSLFAQAPAGYYTSAEGKTGAALKTALFSIISSGTSVVSYNGLWSAYTSTDKKANGKVWDMYSDIPDGTPPYEFTFSSDQCGSYADEGDCYNREHSVPQSWFDSDAPMVSDLFHVYPTDGKVNGYRSDYPYGEVATPTWTSLNGGKLGNCTFPGYTSKVFEPIDAYKGDFARTYFYMATRYEDKIGSWTEKSVFDGSKFPGLSTWQVNLYLKWNELDPVSDKEIARNNAVYAKQKNRNPFIDNPDYVNLIWGPATTTPKLSVSSSTLSSFTYIVGSGPSTSQSYNLSGTDLTGAPGNIVVTAPTNYEVSLSSTTGFASTINVAYTSVTLSATPIYVRLKSGLAVGSYLSQIVTNSGGGAATVANVTCSGSVTAVPSPTLTSSVTTLTGLNYTVGSGPSTAQTFNLSAIALTGYPSNIIVTGPTNYEVSLSSTTGFASTINVAYTSATLSSTPIYVRLKSGLTVGAYNSQNVTISGGGATSINVSCSGSVSEVIVSSDCFAEDFASITTGDNTSTSGSSVAWTGNENFPTVKSAYKAGGAVKLGTSSAIGSITSKTLSDISGNVTVSFDVKGWTTVEGDIKVTLNGISETITYTAVMASAFETRTVVFTNVPTSSTLKIETTAKRAFIDNVKIECGSTSTPSLVISANTLSGFSYILGSGPSTTQTINISGTDLTGAPANILVNAPTNYEVSLNSTTGFASSVNVAYTSATLASTPIYVRLKTDLAVSTYNSELIIFSGGGASNLNVSCNGEVTGVPTPTLTSTKTELTNFAYEVGNGPSSAQSLYLSGINLTDFPSFVVVSAPENYEISIDNIIFTSSLNIDYTSDVLASTVIYVRLKAGLNVGDYNTETLNISGNITNNLEVLCLGTVNDVMITTDCGLETFEKIPTTSPGTYSDRTWTGDDGQTWNATTARTDQVISSGKVITFKGYLETPLTSKGVGNITVTTKFTFSDGTFELPVSVNDVEVGTVPVSATETTTTLTGINVEGDVKIKFTSNGTKRPSIDNLTWTCYNPTGIENIKSINSDFVIYPNPNNGTFSIKSLRNEKLTKILIRDIAGKTIYTIPEINISEFKLNVSSGIYFVELQTEKSSILKKIVVE